MAFLPVAELAIVDVADPGVPNLERVAVRPTQLVNLSEFLLLIGWRNEGGLVPFDAFYFGPKIVQPPSWILVLTGPGNNRSEVAPNGELLHIFHMGRPTTIFVKGVAAGLVRLSAVSLGPTARSPDPGTMPAKRK